MQDILWVDARNRKLGKCKGNNEFKDELLDAIYDSLSVPKFESWMAIINKHGLEDNVWLDGMKTTQRVVSIHSFFDDYVDKHKHWLSLRRCIAEQWRRESRRRGNIMLVVRLSFGRSLVDSHVNPSFSTCYIDMKFKEIQHQCSRIMFLHCFQNVVTSNNVIEYTFADRVWCRNKETKKEYLTQYKRNYRVRFDMLTKLAECECSLFNHSFIICRHMIKLYDILGEEVSNRYILRRWRKDVPRKHTHVKMAYHDPSKTEHVVSYDEMQLAFVPICSKASVFKDTKHLVLEFLELLDIRVDEKRVMIESEMLNQTPSSVCLKDKQVGTPTSTTAKRKADCGIPTPESCKPPSSAGNEGNVKDLPRKAKPTHRTTDHQYNSTVEKAIKAKPKRKTKATVSKGTSHLIDVNQGAILSDIHMF
ncbi:Protein FAR1-RELATED SEQUENCE 6 [Bienertia sinuspersici]